MCEGGGQVHGWGWGPWCAVGRGSSMVWGWGWIRSTVCVGGSGPRLGVGSVECRCRGQVHGLRAG